VTAAGAVALLTIDDAGFTDKVCFSALVDF
jgi:hypothetical protein